MPDRRRVVAAKAIASLIVALAALILTALATLVLTAAFGHAPGGAGTLPTTVIAQGFVTLGGWMLIGLAFGTALQATAPAIVAYLLLPNAWNAVAGAIHRTVRDGRLAERVEVDRPADDVRAQRDRVGTRRDRAAALGRRATAPRALAPALDRHRVSGGRRLRT